MTPAADLLLSWLRAHTGRDRIIAAALNTGQMTVAEKQPPGWRVQVRSRSGTVYELIVVVDPVGHFQRWFRSNEINLGT